MASRYEVVVDPSAPNNSHAFLLGMVGHNKRVLELGAATGHVTKALVDQGCDVAAVEYDPEWAKNLEAIASSVHVLDLNNPAWVKGFEPEFDVITAGDVLEHLIDPVRTLSEMASLLGPDGYIVISVPHIAHADVRMSLLQGKFRYTEYGLLDATHIRFFTYDGVKELAAKAGMAITELKRVRIPAFETEQAVPRASISSEVLDVIMADREAETYQFVFTAVRAGANQKIVEMSETALANQTRAEDLEVVVAKLRGDVRRLQGRVNRLRLNERRARRDLAKLRRTKTFRYTRILRRIYSKLRG
jgi:2-polyprenyl-3-methyl-5-hydroxy-6-metoxy-1,4-benzoquinol methylase